MALVIDQEKCCLTKGTCEKCRGGEVCARCVEVCPVQALEKKNNKIEIDQARCIMCGACVVSCDQEAISFE